jgi:hypothetical protein
MYQWLMIRTVGFLSGEEGGTLGIVGYWAAVEV